MAKELSGAPDKIRTCDLCLRRALQMYSTVYRHPQALALSTEIV
jgi:hypothetical protein